MSTASELNAIVGDEKTAVRFMQRHDLLPADDETWPCKKCHGRTNIYARKKTARRTGAIQQIPTVRCAHRGCQTYHSIRTYNTFFASVGSGRRCSSNLGLGAILELVHHWCWGRTAAAAAAATGRSPDTVAHWYGACRDVCAARYEARAAMGGPGARVRVDAVPLLAGRADGRRLVRAARCGPDAAGERRYMVAAVGRGRDFAAVRHEIAPGTVVLSDSAEYRAGLRSLGYDCRTTDAAVDAAEDAAEDAAMDAAEDAAVDDEDAVVDDEDDEDDGRLTAYPGLDMKTVRKAHGAADGGPLRRCLAEAWYRSTVDKHDDAFIGFLRHINSVHRRR